MHERFIIHEMKFITPERQKELKALLKKITQPHTLDFCSLRVVATESENFEVEEGITTPPSFSDDLGAMLTVHKNGASAFSAT